MRLTASLIISSLLLLICACSNDSPKQKRFESFISEQGGVKIVSLYGSWEKMGEDYGKLAKPYLLDISAFLEEIMDKESQKRAKIIQTANALYENYPNRFKLFMEGSSRTSGIPLETLKVINAVEYVEGFFCSALATWGDYASNGLVFGRNYDAVSYQPLCEDILITVFHPEDSSIPTAIIGYAGELYAVNAINAYGIMLELNNGMPSGGTEMNMENIFSTTALLNGILEARTTSFFDAFFNSIRSNCAFIIGVADANEAKCYEWCLEGVKRGDKIDTPEGMIAMTNHYVNPEWTFPVPTDEGSWNSISRRRNLIALTESKRGNIDIDQMCSIMDTPLEQGGPKHNLTRYQFVFKPSTMTLVMKVTDYHDWVTINIGKYLVE